MKKKYSEENEKMAKNIQNMNQHFFELYNSVKIENIFLKKRMVNMKKKIFRRE